jgi:hypothetical protein
VNLIEKKIILSINKFKFSFKFLKHFIICVFSYIFEYVFFSCFFSEYEKYLLMFEPILIIFYADFLFTNVLYSNWKINFATVEFYRDYENGDMSFGKK